MSDVTEPMNHVGDDSEISGNFRFLDVVFFFFRQWISDFVELFNLFR